MIFIFVIFHNRKLSRVNRELESYKQRLEHLVAHDELTGLPNARYFREHANSRIAEAQRENKQLAIFYIDLDGFKQINDGISHQAGDTVLRTFGQRCRDFVRKNELISRIGGDEFGMVIYGYKTIAELEKTAERLINQCAQPVIIDGEEAIFGLSIGVSIYPNHGKTLDELIAKSDEAMYRVKKTTKGNYAFAD